MDFVDAKKLEEACEEAKNFTNQCHDVVEKIELYAFAAELTNKNTERGGKKKQAEAKEKQASAPFVLTVPPCAQPI